MRAIAVAVIGVLLLSAAAPAYADTIYLPSPQSDQLNGFELFEALGAARERLPGSLVPGDVTNDELVQVEVTGDGSVKHVSDRQRIGLTGAGDYDIREAGPALSAIALGDEPPVLDFGDVVWQGFCPGNRQLGAELVLDPQLESAHLPLRATVSFAAAGRQPAAHVSGTSLSEPGTVSLTITNTTRQRTVLPTAADAPALPVAAALDDARAAAQAPAVARLPTIRTTLPTDLQVTGATTRRAIQIVPLRLNGTLRLLPSHPATAGGASRPDAVSLNGVLQGTMTFTLATKGEGTLELDLTAVPVLEPGPLTPPEGFRSWRAWAAAEPSAAERRSALDLLVQTAATGARASAYSPYLGPELGPAGRTVFHYVLPRAASPVVPTRPLRPRLVPIGLAILGVLTLMGTAVVVWRRS
ncbi:MAG: hypothetical protein QOG07_543 [Pseudonocardiales bacterium]|nr:hypothetical protein [Pseudonocardiales bacterium]